MKDQLISIAEANNAKSIAEKLKNLNKEEYKTSVAFLGEFSSGKTTLVNALLRKQFLPSFDKPTTAIITEITKGEKNHFYVLESVNGTITKKDIEVSELAEEVQKEGNNRILKIEVQDSDLLDDNTILIDTPGVSSINEMHSKVTYGYLPYMDVVFMVVNINMGSISKSLQSFIEGCPENVKEKLHFVLNFKDTKSPSQIEKLVSEFKQSLEEFISNANIIVVSSKVAIKANTSNDRELFEKSGVGKIEEVIKFEIPKTHKIIAEARYVEAIEKQREDLKFFLQEKEKNLKLDKSDFLKKIEELKLEKQELKKESDKIFRDFDELKEKTINAAEVLNKNYVSSFINGLNNDSLEPVTAEYTSELTTVLQRHIDSVENYNLPPYILDKLANSTVNSINNKVGMTFQIANKLPSLINAAAIAASTGGTSLIANVAETIVVQAGGKVLELAEKHIEDNQTKEEVSRLINDSKELAINTLPEKQINGNPVSRKRAVATTILTVLDQLNVTEFAKNKITEATQKSNVYKALKENSNNIINDIFSGINIIIVQKIDAEINNPIRIKEAAIEEVKAELSNSSEQLKTAKNKISDDLVTLYKIAN
ncbi:dynamin family protein [Gillisia sp. CAL575]|uniref:dynamin family protein n=1 Tax=Gillisia sp. CAL575 TaxID=985255 RepID=UPI00039BAB85|nr:dynamin family protein [Gillisia sp. CAL575]